MLLFKKAFWEGLASGRITLTFRRWQSAHVKAGGRYRCHPIGVLAVDDVRQVAVREISEDDAVRSGFESRTELIAYLGEPVLRLGPLNATTLVWRVELHHGGDGDRVDLALQDDLSAEDVETIRAKLAKMDRDAPWTAATLAIIEKNPRVVASKLAKTLGRERDEFKVDVRKLKKLGLTQSFEIGYEIAPRGRAYLAAVGSSVKRARSKKS